MKKLIFLILSFSNLYAETTLEDLGKVNIEKLDAPKVKPVDSSLRSSFKLDATCTDVAGRMFKHDEVGYNRCLQESEKLAPPPAIKHPESVNDLLKNGTIKPSVNFKIST